MHGMADPLKKLNKMLCEQHSFCFTFSSVLGDHSDHCGNENRKYARSLIVNASNVIIGKHGNITTVPTSRNGGKIVTLSYFKLV